MGRCRCDMLVGPTGGLGRGVERPGFAVGCELGASSRRGLCLPFVQGSYRAFLPDSLGSCFGFCSHGRYPGSGSFASSGFAFL